VSELVDEVLRGRMPGMARPSRVAPHDDVRADVAPELDPGVDAGALQATQQVVVRGQAQPCLDDDGRIDREAGEQRPDGPEAGATQRPAPFTIGGPARPGTRTTRR
jgi:hypothetical protein